MKDRFIDRQLDLESLDIWTNLKKYVYTNRKLIFRVTFKGMVITSFCGSVSMVITGIFPIINFFIKFVMPAYQEMWTSI
ncbi:hypothetical protein [Chamaesiphon sp.]|uniref:hypothetical protein n=1 Tax=Chamaesiphon sp. TaxID=2814140 RepID=UPI0035936D81